MLQIFYANRVEQLTDQLVDQLDAQRHINAYGLFTPAVVLVPHERMGDYLGLCVAQRLGISANIRFECAKDFWGAQLEQTGARLIDAPMMRALILESLKDIEWVNQHPSMIAVKRFIGTQAGEERQRRAFGFATNLAKKFETYTHTRAAMLRGWIDGTLWFEQSIQSSMELWQAELWRRIFDPRQGLRVKVGKARQWVLYHELPGLLEQDLVPLPQILHSMDLMTLDATGFALVHASAQRAVVFGYSLNPCAEFWEDMRFGRQEDEHASVLSSGSVDAGSVEYQGDDNFWLEDADAPPLLRLWGFCGAQHMRVISQLEQLEAVELYESFEGHTLLERLKQDILTRSRPDRPDQEHPDDSLRLLSAPSIKREVEVAASEIWSMVERHNAAIDPDDPDAQPLRLSDIAVLVPEEHKHLYQTHIRAVFPNTRGLNFNMVDIDAVQVSGALEAIGLLFNLPFGQFKRQELLRLLTHPNVMGRFPNLDPDVWITWCDELKILHGADRSDHADTYIEGELFHWDQGMRRLVLGAFMTGERARDKRVFRTDGGSWLPHELTQGDMQSAARLVLMARSLIEDARFCQRARMPLTQWADFFCRMTSTYLVPQGVEDTFSLQRARARFANLAHLDLTSEPISYRRAFDLAWDALSDLEVQRGQFLLDGVNVATLMPHRPIPFKVSIVLGLGDGVFPSPQVRTPEDLRFAMTTDGAPVLPGTTMVDVTSRDRQRFAMLEVLMSTTQTLVLSFVDRDMRTGEERAPSAVIGELLYALEEDYILPDLNELSLQDRWMTRHELRRFHQQYFPELFEDAPAIKVTASQQPEARKEAAMSALRLDLVSFCKDTAQPYPSAQALNQALGKTHWPTLSEKLGIHPLEGSSNWLEDRAVLRLSARDIRGFLECPLQGSARFLLKLSDDDGEDMLLEESELFETHTRARMVLLRDIFLGQADALAKGQTPDVSALYDARARYFELAGLVPTGPFYRAARQRHLRTLETWRSNLGMLGLGQDPAMAVHHFGRTLDDPSTTVDHASAPITLEIEVHGAPLQVEISGRTDPMVMSRSASVIPNTNGVVWKLSRKHFLRGFMDHTLMAAQGHTSEQPWRVCINPDAPIEGSYQHKHCIREFEPMQPHEAKHYLGNVVRDMLTEVHAYYLPVEIAFQHLETGDSIAQLAQAAQQNDWVKNSADFGPVRDPRRFAPPENAEQIIQRRLGPVFDRIMNKGKRR